MNNVIDPGYCRVVAQPFYRKFFEHTLLQRLLPLVTLLEALLTLECPRDLTAPKNETLLPVESGSWLALWLLSPATNTTWLRATLLPDDELLLREKLLFISFPLTKVVVLFRPAVPRRVANTDKNKPAAGLPVVSSPLSCESAFFCFFGTPLFSLKSRLLPSALLFLQNKVWASRASKIQRVQQTNSIPRNVE